MIIDIGSGHKPHKQANILLEYKEDGDKHRWNKKLKIDRPIVIYDGDKIPFKNKVFSFSICRHVLEHVKSPGIFLNEIQRISSAGYIETPSEISELIFTPFEEHRWIIYLNNSNELYIKKKLLNNVSKLGKLFDYLYDNEKSFGKFFYTRRHKLFLIEYIWEERIKFKLVASSSITFNDLNNIKTLVSLTKLNKPDYKPKIPRTGTKVSVQKIFKFLERTLLSPCCNAECKYLKTHFSCERCLRRYPINGMCVHMYK